MAEKKIDLMEVSDRAFHELAQDDLPRLTVEDHRITRFASWEYNYVACRDQWQRAAS